jgi:hypothetical protein
MKPTFPLLMISKQSGLIIKFEDEFNGVIIADPSDVDNKNCRIGQPFEVQHGCLNSEILLSLGNSTITPISILDIK